MKPFILSVLFLLSINSNSQTNNAQAALYNIGLGGITSSIGAVLNKKPNEKLSKVLLKGFWQGALGGTIVYGSKQMVYNFHKNDKLQNIWSAKLVNSVGVSIIENAALNQNFYNKWHINIGFNRLEVDVKNNFKVQYKIMPIALTTAIISSTYGKFNFKLSTQTLTPVFISNKLTSTFGVTVAISIIFYNSNRKIKHALAHEIIHVFQYDDYMVINVFFNKKKTKWKHHYNFINKSSKYIYMDLPSAITLRGLYLIENINQSCYYDNYFENEATFYSHKSKCK